MGTPLNLASGSRSIESGCRSDTGIEIGVSLAVSYIAVEADAYRSVHALLLWASRSRSTNAGGLQSVAAVNKVDSGSLMAELVSPFDAALPTGREGRQRVRHGARDGRDMMQLKLDVTTDAIADGRLATHMNAMGGGGSVQRLVAADRGGCAEPVAVRRSRPSRSRSIPNEAELLRSRPCRPAQPHLIALIAGLPK